MRTRFGLTENFEACGHVADEGNLAQRFIVEILADGLSVCLLRAHQFVDELYAAGLGDGCYGFRSVLPSSLSASASVIEARLANTGEPVGCPVALDADWEPQPPLLTGEVDWLGGLRLSGVLPDRNSFGSIVKAIVDGAVVAEGAARSWAYRRRGDGTVVLPAFDLHLPTALADGRVRHVEVVSEAGVQIHGSPCFVVAFADGLAAFIDRVAELESEKIRARHTDLLIPQSLPFGSFADWRRRFPPSPAPSGPRPELTVVLIGDHHLDTSLESLQQQVGVGYVAASLPRGRSSVSFSPEDLSDVLQGEGASADVVIFAPSGTRFFPEALAALHQALCDFAAASSAYCDLAVASHDGPWPVGLTAFDYERCLAQGAGCLVFAMRREAVLYGLRIGAGSLYRLFNSQLDSPSATDSGPVHLPDVLAELLFDTTLDLQAELSSAAAAHLAARGIAADVARRPSAETCTIRIRRNPPSGLVSIIVATRNRPDRIQALSRLLDIGTGPVRSELVIADNDSADPQVLASLDDFARKGVRIVKVAGAASVARARNAGAGAASGEYLMFVGEGFSAEEDTWLEELMSYMAEFDVGAVGPLLVWPSRIIRGAGVVLGPGLAAAPAFSDRILGEAGYAGLLETAHEVSALSGDAMLTRRHLFDGCNGFEALTFSAAFADVDYCLKLRAEGSRIVVTPHAHLFASDGPGPGENRKADDAARLERERTVLRARWGEVLIADPFYSPWLSIDGPPFSALAWPPRSRAARQNQSGLPRPLPLGL